MGPNLQELINRARGIRMTDAERERQRQSFAYGNTKIENDAISRDSIVKAAKTMRGEGAHDAQHKK